MNTKEVEKNEKLEQISVVLSSLTETTTQKRHIDSAQIENMRRKDLTNKIQVLRKADLLLVSAKRIQRKLVQPFTGDAIQCSL